MLLTAVSATLYEAAYTGCRFRDAASSVLTVRSDKHAANEQRKELTALKSSLKSIDGVSFTDLKGLEGSSSRSRRLSAGAIVGIVIGVIAFLAIVGIVIYIVLVRSPSEREPSDSADYLMMRDVPPIGETGRSGYSIGPAATPLR